MELIEVGIVFISHPPSEVVLENSYGQIVKLPAVPREGEYLFLPLRTPKVAYARFMVKVVRWYHWSRYKRHPKPTNRVELDIIYFPEE
jgi:hypothetical protein